MIISANVITSTRGQSLVTVVRNRRSAACVSPFFVLGERCRAVRGAVEFAIEHCQRVASIGRRRGSPSTANLYCVIASDVTLQLFQGAAEMVLRIRERRLILQRLAKTGLRLNRPARPQQQIAKILWRPWRRMLQRAIQRYCFFKRTLRLVHLALHVIG